MIRGVEVCISLGYPDDSDLDLVVKSKKINLGLDPGGELGGLGVTFQEASSSPNIEHWPPVSVQDLDRRDVIFRTAQGVLETAEEIQASSVGFFTMGLELSRVPSWEVGEEIVRAIDNHIGEDTSIRRIVIVASTPTQVSSFQFALNNIRIIRHPDSGE